MATREALLRGGITKQQIQSRVRSGGWIREYPTVYRIGNRAPNREATYMAAVLACGRGALLSGRAAAHLLGLLKGKPPPPEVLVAGDRRVRGLLVHRTRAIHPRDRWTWLGIPCTSPARTLVDLAGDTNEAELGRAVHEAGIRHHTKPEQVEATLQRRPNAPGAAFLRAICRGDAPILLSRMEQEFRHLLTVDQLVLPIFNRYEGAYYVDCRWPEHKLTVELDSYTVHNSRHAWEQSHRRERQAYARGDAFRRYNWTDVSEETEPMLGELRGFLRPPASGRSR